jgi:hypothetical protein
MKLQSGSREYGKLELSIWEHINHLVKNYNYYSKITNLEYDNFIIKCVDILTSNYSFDSVVIVTTEMPFNWCYHLSKIYNIKLFTQ